MANYKPLWHYGLEVVKHDSIYVDVNRLLKKRFFYENPLQALLVDMLVYGEGIGVGRKKGRVVVEKYYGERRMFFLARKGDMPSELVYPGEDFLSPKDLDEILPSRPLFVVLNSLYRELTESDRKRLALQLGLMVSTIRKWLWDKHLIFVDTPSELLIMVEKRVKPNKVVTTSLQGLCSLISPGERIIALDPYADDVLDEKTVYRSTVFLIGGVVDRDKPLKKATSRLVEFFIRECGFEVNSYHLEVDGIVMAVPHRLNRILEILLKTLFNGMKLREAIISTMTNRDIAWYLGMLLSKYKSIDLKGVLKEIESLTGRRISSIVIEKAKRIAGLG